ncbi:hypothetical protein Rsub_09591 [Raphidocelis subcapitata]|uniref:Uncharacterized protein n=1 Tax=Raphidocelis subcapitata TaxID=307507 RepID=A0A2V0PK61_9CHLO|nr:hypothetical protein Rsub_09591 [Raphidocelis subcapitata]|eukprot:GBF97425.1 hypothetical protein Rsub_09591 [Raphidocelis subcapitata]
MAPRERADEYYAEETFGGHVSGGRVYTGPLLMVGFSIIIGCFCMATLTKKSPNLQFRWLQRRVGAQIGTCVYFATTNVMYAHDGKHWQTRDLDRITKRMFGPALRDLERWQQRRSSSS